MSPRAKWISAAVMLVVLGGIGLVLNRRTSDAPITVRDAGTSENVPAAAGSGTSGAAHSLEGGRPHLPTPPGSAGDDTGGGELHERGMLAKLPAVFELTKTSSGHVAVNLAGGASTSFGYDAAPKGTHAIHGRVVDRAGTPVTGALVIADAYPHVRLWAGSVMGQAGTTTANDGSFAILDGPDTGSIFALDARAGWSAVQSIGDGPITLTLLGHGALHGVLRYTGHGETFAISLDTPDKTFSVGYESDPDGTFTVASLPPGPYHASVGLAQVIAGGSSKYTSKDIAITADQTTELAIDQTAGTTIAIEAKPRGQSTMEYILFTGAGAPDIASANTRRKAENAPWYLLGGADAASHMEFHDVTPGSYTVCAAADSTASYGCKSLVILDGESVRELEIQLVPNADGSDH